MLGPTATLETPAMRRLTSSFSLLAAVSLAVLWPILPRAASAADTLRVGIASPSMTFVPLFIARQTDRFAAANLDVAITEFAGAARLHQAVLSGSIDVALGGGTDYAFLVKGAPEIAVAALTERPLNFAVIVGNDPTITDLDDLRGRRIGVSGSGTLTYWLARQLGVARGWGPSGAIPVAIGTARSVLAASLQTGQVTAVITEPALGYQLESEHRGRVLAPVSAFVPEFMTNTAYAATALSRAHPGRLRRFLAAYLNAVAWLLDHRAETVAIAAQQTGITPAILAREYDAWLPMWSRDGRIRPDLLALVSQALMDSGLTSGHADLARYTTANFLPAQPAAR